MSHQDIERQIQFLSESYNPFSLHSFSYEIKEGEHIEFYRIGHDDTYDFHLGVSPKDNQLYKYIEWQIGVDEDGDPTMNYRIETIKDFNDLGYIGQHVETQQVS